MKTITRTSAKLYLLVIIISVFIVITGVIGIREMGVMNRNTQSLITDRTIPVQELNTIRFEYANTIVSLLQAIENKQVKTEDAVHRIKAAEQTINTIWQAYLKTYLTPKERSIVNAAIPLKQSADQLLQELTNKIYQKNPALTEDRMDEEALAIINPLVAKLNELIDLQIEVGGTLLDANVHVYKTAIQRFYILLPIFFLFIIVLSYYVIGDVKKLLTKLHQTNSGLKESEEKYKYLFHNSPAYIILWDLETLKVIDINNTVFEKYGYTRAEWLRMTVLDYRRPEEADRIRAFALRMLESNESFTRGQWHHLKKNKEEMIMEIVSHKINYNGRKAILSLAIDVTEQVKIQDALKKQEGTFHSLVDHAADAIFFVDIDGIIFDVNKSACKLFQYTKEELKGKSVLLLHPKNVIHEIPAIWEQLKRDGFYYPEERVFIRKDGTPVEVEISRTMLPDRSGAIAILRDITERKQAEKKLRKSEETLRALVENISDAIIFINEDFTTVYRSPSVAKVIGYSLEEMERKALNDLIYAEDTASFFSFLKQSMQLPGTPINGQFRLLHKNGNIIWVEGTAVNLIDNKDINACVINYRDITERKKLEEEQLLLASIVDSSNEAIISKTPEGIVTSWNKSAERILGYTAEEMIGKSIRLIIPEALSAEEDHILQTIRAGKHIDRLITKRINKQGNYIDVSLNISPIKDVFGNIIGVSKILFDITDKLRAEERIKKSEENYRRLFELSPASMWLIDETTKNFEQVNSAALSKYGYSMDEFLHMKFDDILFEKKTGNANDRKDFFKEQGRGSSFTETVVHKTKSGERVVVIMSSIPVIIDEQNKMLMISLDITERVELEQRLAIATIKAQEDERYEIGAELHDNVCQLLATAMMYLSMLKTVLLPEGETHYHEIRKLVHDASEETRNLSHQLAPVFYEDDKLEILLKRALHNFNLENRYTVDFYINEAAKGYLLDRELVKHLYRILQEQLRNINKHSKATRVVIDVLVEEGGLLVLRIKDNGVGFDVKEVKNGIGLSNINRRVQLFSGVFHIHSTKGEGCEIMIEIPLQLNDSIA
ncbi:MAG: PAS domain S-box protein [Bacteroidota bacterium]|nr:PAS domain S-box protein [Bacteroidota bacterium]